MTVRNQKSTRITRRIGFGIDLRDIRLDGLTAEPIWSLLSLVPEYEEEIMRPIMHRTDITGMTALEALKNINLYSPLLALAEILATVIATKEDLSLTAAEDCFDSEKVVLAYAVEDYSSTDGKQIRDTLDAIFPKYLANIFSGPCKPYFVEWHEEAEIEVDVDIHTLRSRTGYGFNVHAEHIWPDSAEALWKLIDMAPNYAKSLEDIRSELDPSSVYARAELLESINFDNPEFALAQVLANVINEAEGMDIKAVIDFADSDNVILAYWSDPNKPPKAMKHKNEVDAIFRKYLSVITHTPHYPIYVYWSEEVEPKREFFVDTPMGKIKVYSKHDKDCPADYPGVYVDFVEPGGDLVPLACVEYNSVDKWIQTCVYGDGSNDSPTEVVHHENLATDSLSKAMKLISEYCEGEFDHPCDVADFADLSKVPVGYTTVTTNEVFGIQAYADLKNFAINVCIQGPGKKGENRVTEDLIVIHRPYDSLEKLIEFELEDLCFEDLISFDESDWLFFSRDPIGRKWLEEEYPIGCMIDWRPTCSKKVLSRVKAFTDDGKIVIDTPTETDVALLFGYDDFYHVKEGDNL